MKSFEEANKKVHKVEDQWHHPILIKYGFKPETEYATGFVRKYKYTKGDHIILAHTGCSSDYWSNARTGDNGYWNDLEPHLKTLEEK